MPSSTLLSLLGALLVHQVAAFPAASPQGLDFDVISALPPAPTYTMSVDAVSQSVDINTAAMVSSVYQAIATQSPSDVTVDKVKRNACSPLPTGVVGLVAPNSTVSDFMASEQIVDAALGALTPTNYTQVYQNMNGSTSAYYYMGYTLMNSYDVATCAAKCSGMNLCQSFNIYHERAPVVVPGSSCPNPQATTLIKCVFWGGPISANTATNVGQWQQDFHVVIAGSNGYVATDYWSTHTMAGYEAPAHLDNRTINAPLDCNGNDTYMGVRMFNNGPFDPNLCAATCSATSAFDIAHGLPTAANPQTCHFFVTYMLLKNGQPVGQYCAMYSQDWSGASSPAMSGNNYGQYDGQGNHYTIGSSYMSGNSTSPGIPIACQSPAP